MLRVGLTGGIGSGKSLVSAFFERHGITVVDADIVAREVVEPGSHQLEHIASHFGQQILLPDGTLDRAKLRSIIFNNDQEKLWLEGLLHPVIRDEICAQLDAAPPPFVILASPLLLETDQHRLMDLIITIDVLQAQQIERACKRDNNSKEQIKNIIAKQLSREERIERADRIIDNSGTIDATLVQCQALFDELLNIAEK